MMLMRVAVVGGISGWRIRRRVQRYKTCWPARHDRKHQDPALKWADASSSAQSDNSRASSRKQQLLCC
ncbi:hypothetical protein WJX82_007856 [Trebouxia sp. C0006]